MRIPPYHRTPTWQRFFAGAALGGLISWVIFFYMHGVQQETADPDHSRTKRRNQGFKRKNRNLGAGL